MTRLVALLLACSLAEAAPLDRCIQIARSNQGASFSNACGLTVHVDFEVTGGMDNRSRPCRSHKGTYAFAANEKEVELPISTCTVRYWVCDTATREHNGGSCRRP